jgi:serine protease Do
MNLLRRTAPMLFASFFALMLLSGTHPALAADADEVLPAQRGQPIGGDDDEAESTAVETLADVYKAVVQIEAVGTFVDPEQGMLANAAGTGSGFIIDEAGIAVTNNHVVTGGALFRVYVADEEEPRNARVLGVAECADLAVIDIQGDGYSYLDWYEGPIRVGLDIYAAGFPLGDPEYTLTRGIVAKSSAGGESSWASVDEVLQHDADIVPGNSGGPLVDSEGKVVGVNYRLNQAGQYFAISRDEALSLIERLRGGENVDSIGINGEAVTVDEGLTGIWISSTDSGSPADAAGILPGDILLTMEGLDLATDGTMQTYCDILRSHSPDDVLAIEVLRLDTQEVLEGQLNGRTLERSFSFADNAASGNDDTSDASDGPVAGYAEYMTITDEQGIMAFEVPVEWQDVLEEPWTNDDEETIGLQLWAVPDLDAFYEDWGIPGVVFSYSDILDPAEISTTDLIDAIDYSETCTYAGRESIPEGFYTGDYDLWEGCNEDGASAMILGLVPETADYLLRIEVYTAGDADYEAMDRILDTFLITPPGTATDDDDGDDSTAFGSIEEIDTSELIYDYMLVESDAATVLLPAEWEDVVATDWVDNGELISATLTAAYDTVAFNDVWSEPGVAIYSLIADAADFPPVELLEENDFSDACTYDDRVEHLHTIAGITYSGAYDIWTDCGGEENAFVVLAAAANTGDHVVLIYFSAVSDADVEAFDVLTSSFYVVTDATAPLIADQAPGPNEGVPFDPDDYTIISDSDGAVAMSVPQAWSDVANDDWVIDGDVMGRALTAAPDVASFEETWETPGVFAGVSSSIAETFTPDEVLDLLDFGEDCIYEQRYDYANDALEGLYDVWYDCGDVEGSVFVTLAANPAGDEGQLLLLYIYMVEEADVTAFEQILATITVGDQERITERQPTATVVTAALNVRSGPGTNYGRIAAVNQGDVLTVAGQSNSCSWLLIFTPDGQPGWVSGNSQYTTLNGACADIPEADGPAPAGQTGNGQSSGGQAAGSQGCYTFQNELGAELNITFTRRGDGWNTTFQVAPKGENRQCFDPGNYTYTLDAPPPWGSTNGELTVSAGDNFAFPIYGE